MMAEKGIFVKKAIVLLFVTAILPVPCLPQTKAAAASESAFRSPFLLKLHIDREHNYEQTFGRVPYVAENEVYLFAGESFGINVTVSSDQMFRIAYQPDSAKADVEFKFTQEPSPDGFMMLLVTRNKLKRKLSFEGMMTIPGEKQLSTTSVLPVEPGISSFESWPHPIVQLVLSNFRLSDSGSR